MLTNRWILAALVVGLLSIGAPALAADGDECDTATSVRHANYKHGKTLWKCVQLCDSDTTNGACSTLDLFDHGGIHDIAVIELQDVTNCAAGYNVVVTGQWSTVANVNTHAETTLNATTTSATFLKDAALGPILIATRNVSAACTNLEVWLHLGIYK